MSPPARFRQDLLFRLNTIEIHLPPLRERREDIPLLATHFLTQHAQTLSQDAVRVRAVCASGLLEHSWPGNIRELDHAVERAVLMAQGPSIKTAELGLKPAGIPRRASKT